MSKDDRLEALADFAGKARNDLLALIQRSHAVTDGFQIRFDGPPAQESGRFIETEALDGSGISLGEWIQDGDYWLLRVPPTPAVDPERVARLIAHRQITNEEHDASVGMYAGDCAVCRTPWPCGDART